MSLVDIEVGLTDQEREIVDTVHKFAAEVLRPIGVELDRLDDPNEVIASGSALWQMFKKYEELGLEGLDSPDAGLSPVERARVRIMINEELGWGDSGLAVSLAVASMHRIFAQMSGTPELIERFCGHGKTEIGCWAITEPDHGSDTLGFNQPHFGDGAVKANCSAQLDGDEYVIRGQKAAWVSNGTIADVAALFCTVDQSQGFKGGGVAIVPLDLPGVSKGKAVDKIGQRPLNQGEIFFDEVRIPASHMVMGTEAYGFVLETVLTMANAMMGATFTGVARAALEYAIDYAKERVQGGVSIIEHQSVKARLFKMFSRVEAARSLARRAGVYNSIRVPGLVQYSIASKVFATNTAFEVASEAVQIYGGNGLSREYPVEKLLRDARAAMIEDGCNEVLGLVAASKL
jgi:alkylation response protein AidB-like acyl-CoA dehydrogenase